MDREVEWPLPANVVVTPGELSPPTGLVHRARELAHIDHLLTSVRRGERAAVALRGWPGIGKTALIQAAAGRATDLGTVQLRGTADVRRASREWPPALYELLTRFESSAPEPGGAPASARKGRSEDLGRQAAMVGSAVAGLQQVADVGRRPLLLVVDDCHVLPRWFSAALAEAVAGPELAVPVGLVLAWRDTPHVPSFELGVPGVPELRLAPLGVEGAEELFVRLEMRVPERSVLRLLVDATAGVPCALIEVHDRLSVPQLQGRRPLPWPVPVGHGLALAYGVRPAALSERGRMAAAVAALGAPTPVLAAALDLLGLSIEMLEEPQEAGIFKVLRDHVDFEHPLVRVAAFRQMPEEERDRIHLAVSDAFEAGGHIVHSAFHAAQSAMAPHDDVARRYAAVARLALDRGNPSRSATYEEMASELAESDDRAASHLAHAAALWTSVGDHDRALANLDRADRLSVSGPVRGELDYRRARLAFAAAADRGTTTGVAPAEAMRTAAELCLATSPHRAALMLVDAAACDLLHSSPAGAVATARRALELASGVNSHVEALAQATLTAACSLEGRPADDDTGGWRWTMVLDSLTQGFSASPHLAYVIGDHLVLDGRRSLATQWAQAIGRCAQSSGNRALASASFALLSTLSLSAGAVDEARAHAEAALVHADRQLAARVLATLTAVHAAAGSYREGFEAASQLFALSGDVGRVPRLQARVSLANLELQSHPGSSMSAWLASAWEEVTSRLDDRGEADPWDAVCARWAPSIAEMMVLGRRGAEAWPLVGVVERALPPGRPRAFWMAWIRGLCSPDLDQALAHLASAAASVGDVPLVEARVQLMAGVRLAEAGKEADARTRLASAGRSFRSMQAQGWATLADRELAALGAAARAEAVSPPGAAPGSSEPAAAAAATTATTATTAATAGPPGPAGAPGPDGTDTALSASDEPRPEWQIELLGSFVVRRHGAVVQMPYSLATQALMIAALRRKIPVEELVEILWPDAEPGVGMRRLRNVLWRIRVACGGLLLRDGNFIRLAEGATVDDDLFRRSAATALKPSTPNDEAVTAARAALRMYHGDLLPGERYADWATGRRESSARLHIQLLELLLTEALRSAHIHDAMQILEQLIEADPYEEQHHLQLAELYVRSGNRGRALRVIEHAARMLEELDLPPSDALAEVRRSLGAVTPDDDQVPALPL